MHQPTDDRTPINYNQQLATAAKTLQTFSGNPDEDVQSFVSDFTEYLILIHAPEHLSKILLSQSLQGSAKQWFSTVLRSASLQDMISQLVMRFESSNKLATALNIISDTRYNYQTPLLQYLDKMKLTAMRGQISEEVLLAMVYKNMPPEVQSKINISRQNNEVSWENIYYMAKIFDETPKPKVTYPETFAIGSARYNKQHRDRTPIQGKAYKKNQKNKGKYCKYHRSQFHSTEECRVLKNKVNHVDCDEDDEEDHEYNENDNKINKTSHSYITLNQIRSHFIVLYIKFNNMVLNCLLDTGSQLNIIKYHKNLHSLIMPSTENLYAANNSPMKVKGEIKNLKFKIDETAYISNFLVVENISQECILGLNFINEYVKNIEFGTKYHINFKKNTFSKIFHIKSVEDINHKYKNLFDNSENQNSNKTMINHRIDTGEHKPIAKLPYRQNTKSERDVTTEIRNLLSKGIIRKSKSPWRSRIVPHYNKNGKFRLCIDFRPLNSITKKDSYLTPRTDDILDFLGDGKYFSTLDWLSGYYQISVDDTDIEKTAFSCKDGTYEFTKMPFGLINAPATFQRIVDDILGDLRWKICIAYLDDIIIKANTIEEHEINLNLVLSKLSKHNIKLNATKCKIFKKEINILGHIVSQNSIKIDNARIVTIQKIPRPTSIKELQSFLGLVTYVRKFIKNIAELSSPLYSILKQKEKQKLHFTWNEKCEISFTKIKKAISDSSTLRLPDLNEKFILTTDASENGMGAALSQLDENGDEKIVAYWSKTINTAQKNYSATDKELLSVVESIKNFRNYLAFTRFTLRTDHKPLIYLFNTKNLSSRLLRWSLILQEYQFDIEYLKGKLNFSDQLSRMRDQMLELDENIEKGIALNKCNQILPLTKYHCTDKKQIASLLKEYHTITGHGSLGTTHYLLASKYYWPNMKKEIQKHINECLICAKDKPFQKNKEHVEIKNDLPEKLYQIDLIGPLETSTSGNRFIITMIDNFTKAAFTQAIPYKTGQNVLKFITEIFKTVKLPFTVISDNGLEFNNKLVQNYAETNKIKWKFSSAFHPETNGTIERFNQTLIHKIRKISDFGLKDWDECLPQATKAYSYSYSRSIGRSPYEAHNLCEPIFPIDLLIQPNIETNKFEKSDTTNKIQKHRAKYVLEYVGKLGYKTKKLVVGDLVLYWDCTAPKGKLWSRWLSGFKIKELRFKSFVLETPSGNTVIANERYVKKDLSTIADPLYQ
jgi:hypothetical protein